MVHVRSEQTTEKVFQTLSLFQIFIAIELSLQLAERRGTPSSAQWDLAVRQASRLGAQL